MSALEAKRPVGSAEASYVERYEDAYSPEGYSGDEGNEPSDDHEPLPGHEAASLPEAISLRGGRDMRCTTHMRVQQPEGNEAQKYNGEAVHEDCPCE